MIDVKEKIARKLFNIQILKKIMKNLYLLKILLICIRSLKITQMYFHKTCRRTWTVPYLYRTWTEPNRTLTEPYRSVPNFSVPVRRRSYLTVLDSTNYRTSIRTFTVLFSVLLPYFYRHFKDKNIFKTINNFIFSRY